MIIEIKCTINVMWLSYPETILLVRSMEKLSSTKLIPAAKKVGGHWPSGLCDLSSSSGFSVLTLYQFLIFEMCLLE